MTSTTRAQPPTQRWPGVVIGLLIGLAAVCHGCHIGDRDDELSLTGGKQRVERHQEEPTPIEPDADAARLAAPLH